MTSSPRLIAAWLLERLRSQLRPNAYPLDLTQKPLRPSAHSPGPE